MPRGMNGTKGASTSPDQIATLMRERRALELRAMRLPFHRIAEELGYADPSGAYRAVKRAMDRLHQEPADDLRRVEVETLDNLFRIAFAKAQQPGPGQMGAVEKCIMIMDRRAKLLGLDAPQRRIVDVVQRDQFQEMMIALNAELAQLESGE